MKEKKTEMSETRIGRLGLLEKAALLSGGGAWKSRALPRRGLPALFFSDGPHGIRKQEGVGDHLGLNASLPATCFPTAATVANSWDTALAEEVGEALGSEARSQGVDILLGPGLNIKRSPLCGRNFEYFSEDPYLSGKLAAAYVRGIQRGGALACVKHYAVNSQEFRRMILNAEVDERALREIYLTGFEIAVKEGKPGALMTSYNQVNGLQSNENPQLMLEILRKEWGYDGMVVTDWGGSDDHIRGIQCRTTIEMPDPGLHAAREVMHAVERGELSEAEIDACLSDYFRTLRRVAVQAKKAKPVDPLRQHALARRAARESAVLLKNDGILPLTGEETVALIGDFARVPRYQGAGSSLVNSRRVETLRGQLTQRLGQKLLGTVSGYARHGNDTKRQEARRLRKALRLARRADCVIFCGGLDEMAETEGLDRKTLALPTAQRRALRALAAVNPNIVLVLSAGSVVDLAPAARARAILHGYLGGEAGAGAMAELLYGDANPSGKLAESYPLALSDTPAYPYRKLRGNCAEYRESIYVGYRYYDKAKVPLRYPFGFGLSYTRFAYEDLRLSEEGVRFRLRNTGSRAGAEIAELYICAAESETFRPEKELKGFAKVFLKAGEEREVFIPFDDKSFRVFDSVANRFLEESGRYRILIGASAADIRLNGELVRAGEKLGRPDEKKRLPHYFSGAAQQIGRAEFERLLGRKLERHPIAGELLRGDALHELRRSRGLLARLLYRQLRRALNRSAARREPDLNLIFAYHMPFRAFSKFGSGKISPGMTEGLLMMLNGHLFGGFRKFVIESIKNRRENRRNEKALR
ncbi:beta-glucosidase [Stomatobaculum longum]|uniref:beta-glucosidase n=1 Tax=Stomatobaculum longum TaxID=796942 RepID=UPI0028DC4740|nr:glycoside hydrolase family 3 C-terminal domain-containing protein [Stomatobaculum longum]